MIKLYFGHLDNELFSGNGFFNSTVDEGVLLTDFGKAVVKSIDNSEVYGRNLIISPILGGIPPERLSGGTKTLLSLYSEDNVIFRLSAMGDNCLPFLADIAKIKDITLSTSEFRPLFRNSSLDKVLVLNDNSIVTNDKDLLVKSLKVIRNDR